MPISRWVGMLGAVVASTFSVASAVSAQTAPSLAAESRPDLIRVRIEPEVDRVWPALRGLVNNSGTATVAEPADILLTTNSGLGNFGQLEDIPHDGVKAPAFPTVSLGRWSDDGSAALPGVLRALRNQKILASLAERPTPADFILCRLVPATDGSTGECASRELADAAAGFLEARADNHGTVPRYVAIVETSINLSIRSLDVIPGQKVIRLDPGKSLMMPSGDGPQFNDWLLVADHPFDPAMFDRPAVLNSKATCLTRVYPECLTADASAPPPVTALAGLSAIRFSRTDEEPNPAMGGGTQVDRGDADWMVELYSTLPYTQAELDADAQLAPNKTQYLKDKTPEERAHTCGGTMIAPNLVLTAAHCVATGRFLKPNENRLFTDRRIRIGSLRLGRGGETRAVIGAVINDGYSGIGSGLPGDIALLMVKSDESIVLAPRPLKVATKPTAGSTVTGLGWGYTKAVAPGANIHMSLADGVQHNPGMLQQAPLEVLDSAACAKRFPDKLKAGMICLVTPKKVAAPTFSCRGDSGGPLVRNYGSDEEELVGLTSWSEGCGFENTPSVYTDVAYFSAWAAAARAAIRPGQVIRLKDPAHNP